MKFPPNCYHVAQFNYDIESFFSPLHWRVGAKNDILLCFRIREYHYLCMRTNTLTQQEANYQTQEDNILTHENHYLRKEDNHLTQDENFLTQEVNYLMLEDHYL